MSDFQWKKDDIQWFVKKFKSETGSINTRSVQQSYKRRKKPTALDCRMLMRAVVRSGFARVVAGHVDSNQYQIKMISGNYSYIAVPHRI
jgi:hypothetical protein